MSLSRMFNVANSKNQVNDKAEFSNEELLAAATIDFVLDSPNVDSSRSSVVIEQEIYYKYSRLSEYAMSELADRFIQHTNIDDEDALEIIDKAKTVLSDGIDGVESPLDNKVWNGALSVDKMLAQKLLNDEVRAAEERQLEKESQRRGVNIVRDDTREVLEESKHKLRLNSRRAREQEDTHRRI